MVQTLQIVLTVLTVLTISKTVLTNFQKEIPTRAMAIGVGLVFAVAPVVSVGIVAQDQANKHGAKLLENVAAALRSYATNASFCSWLSYVNSEQHSLETSFFECFDRDGNIRPNCPKRRVKSWPLSWIRTPYHRFLKTANFGKSIVTGAIPLPWNAGLHSICMYNYTRESEIRGMALYNVEGGIVMWDCFGNICRNRSGLCSWRGFCYCYEVPAVQA
jgi:hypothetical protein